MVSVFLSRSVKMIVFLLTFFVAVAVMGILRATLKDGGNPNNGTRSGDTLRLVVVVSSHGNIAASSDYPDDPYPLAEPSYWPYGSLHLTPEGRVQMYSLGAEVRRLYHGFLGGTYRAEDAVAASTPLDRVVVSGQMLLAGLYPPGEQQAWYKDVAWQPVPLYTDSPDNSATVLGGGCAAFTLAEATSRTQFSEIYAANLTAVTDLVNNATGSHLTGSSAVHALYDKLLSEDIEGYTNIPSWAGQVYPQVLQGLVGAESALMFTDKPEIARLLIGNLLADSLDVMQAKVDGSLSQSLYFYSGHAYSLLGLLTALGIPPSSIVGDVMPGSALLLELHEHTNSSQFTVQVMYIDGGASSVLEPVSVDVPECGNPCDFYTLVNITHDFTSDVDFTGECKVSNSTLSKADEQQVPYSSDANTVT